MVLAILDLSNPVSEALVNKYLVDGMHQSLDSNIIYR